MTNHGEDSSLHSPPGETDDMALRPAALTSVAASTYQAGNQGLGQRNSRSSQSGGSSLRASALLWDMDINLDRLDFDHVKEHLSASCSDIHEGGDAVTDVKKKYTSGRRASELVTATEVEGRPRRSSGVFWDLRKSVLRLSGLGSGFDSEEDEEEDKEDKDPTKVYSTSRSIDGASLRSLPPSKEGEEGRKPTTTEEGTSKEGTRAEPRKIVLLVGVTLFLLIIIGCVLAMILPPPEQTGTTAGLAVGGSGQVQGKRGRSDGEDVSLRNKLEDKCTQEKVVKQLG
mmetsp:Transcript_5090/g.14630  ORF Transcript_5090/g.14630 Transcript_5090/m.14630 type:complete len:285 (-) Transcript_5090:476-1330(-)